MKETLSICNREDEGYYVTRSGKNIRGPFSTEEMARLALLELKELRKQEREFARAFKPNRFGEYA